MKKIQFTAEDSDFTSLNDIDSVPLLNSEEERILSFQYDRVNGGDTNYIELDDN